MSRRPARGVASLQCRGDQLAGDAPPDVAAGATGGSAVPSIQVSPTISHLPSVRWNSVTNFPSTTPSSVTV